jgi:hypothetical protein
MMGFLSSGRVVDIILAFVFIEAVLIAGRQPR